MDKIMKKEMTKNRESGSSWVKIKRKFKEKNEIEAIDICLVSLLDMNQEQPRRR